MKMQGATHTRLGSSELVHLLTGLLDEAVPPARQGLVERVGQWLDIGDALNLYAVLHADLDAHMAVRAGGTAAVLARREFERVRTALADAILADGVAGSGKVRYEWPDPEPAPEQAGDDALPDYGPYHRHHLAHQRDQQAQIATLRSALRATLARQSPGHKRLAELDALFEKAFAARERILLARVPEWLCARFASRYREHRACLVAHGRADDPAGWMLDDGWLAAFRADMQAVLLAELALRLQPAAGLLAALDQKELDWQ